MVPKLYRLIELKTGLGNMAAGIGNKFTSGNL